MNEILFAIALFVSSACAPAFATIIAPALVHDDNTGGELVAKLNELGYDTKDLNRNETTYTARIVDRGTGNIVQAIFDAKTRELLEARLEELTATGE